MPVDYSGRRVDDVARVHLDHGSAFDLSARNALLDENDLTAFMTVPFRSRAWGETEMGDGAVRAFLDARDGAGEVRLLLSMNAPRAGNREGRKESQQRRQRSS